MSAAATGPRGLDPVVRRAARRSLHRSRSAPAVVALVVAAVLAVYLGTEAVLRLLDRPALLATPGALADAAVRVLQDPSPAVTAVGVALVVLGVVLLGLALAPGHRSRRAMAHERLAVVVDDAVLASALTRTATTVAGLQRGRAQTWLTRRRADVRLQPTSGVEPPLEQVRAAVAEQVRITAAVPPLRAEVRAAARGSVS